MFAVRFKSERRRKFIKIHERLEAWNISFYKFKDKFVEIMSEGNLPDSTPESNPNQFIPYGRVSDYAEILNNPWSCHK